MTDPATLDYADTLEAQMIADYVSDGKTIKAACRILGITRRQSVYERMKESARFTEMMEAARTAGADAIADDVIDIIDDTTEDVEMTRFGPRANKEFIARSKVRAEYRIKLLAKWHPKKYGEKLQIESNTRSVAIPPTDDPIAAQKAYEQLMKGE